MERGGMRTTGCESGCLRQAGGENGGAEMQFRLNRWQAIGIAISLVWALAGGFWGYQLGNRWSESAGEDAISRLYQCLNNETSGPGSAVCEQRERAMQRSRSCQWPAAALLALGPIPIGWFRPYLLIRLRRRMRPGQQSTAV